MTENICIYREREKKENIVKSQMSVVYFSNKEVQKEIKERKKWSIQEKLNTIA